MHNGQIPLCRLPRDVRDKRVTSPLAQIPLRRLPPKLTRTGKFRGNRRNGSWALRSGQIKRHSKSRNVNSVPSRQKCSLPEMIKEPTRKHMHSDGANLCQDAALNSVLSHISCKKYTSESPVSVGLSNSVKLSQTTAELLRFQDFQHRAVLTEFSQ